MLRTDHALPYPPPHQRRRPRLMCGIAGLSLALDAPPPDPAIIEALTRAIAHRGPDGSGHTIAGQSFSNGHYH